jgi:glutamate---cysteine ligase / carboxylate-amine ligase
VTRAEPDNVRTVGVEEEFLLARKETDELAPAGELVVTLAARRADPADADVAGAAFEHEFKREQAELGTPPCHTLAELTTQLQARRRLLADAARDHGARLLVAGTSPLADRATPTDDQRYDRMNATYAAVARQQLSCGMHVHVAVDSRAEGVAVLDRIRPWLSVLIALSANSPFSGGHDTGYASYRSVLWGQWPSATVTEAFGDEAGYQRVVDALIASGAALDDGMIYFEARLSASYPTVEIRVADVCLEVEDAVSVAGLARGLVEACVRRAAAGEPVAPVRSELLRAASWAASRYGVSGALIDPETGRQLLAWTRVEALVDWIGDAFSADERGHIETGLAEIRRRGTGADRQRAAYGPSGRIQDVVDVVTEPSGA